MKVETLTNWDSKDPSNKLHILATPSGLGSISISNYGATITAFNIAGQNIVASYSSPEHYRSDKNPYFGATIGRVANRVANARFELGGKTYELDANEKPHSLHGGPGGFHQKIWDGPAIETRHGREVAVFSCKSAHMEEGYPGDLEVKVIYSLEEAQKAGQTVVELGVEYEAELVGGSNETIVNLTNHSYWNISGGPTIEGTEVVLNTASHLATDESLIPTGKIESHPKIPLTSSGTPEKFTLGPDEPAVDHCFVLITTPPTTISTLSTPLQTFATLTHPATHLTLSVATTEPSCQFYTGDGVDFEEAGWRKRAGVCLEAARWVNAGNVEGWRGMVALKKGERYESKTVYSVHKEQA
ncbi:hypothetical protein G7K_3586-t1 [Saitoella complicata NRRL Y-17804]|uniref:Aldose 1-epimerase n=1 Tax=Saitoella complicata (strain BCRC 22490 / CBS 7301 / JCM 7358 / NBRC 10748 / NRRL Y-17804) TaxID=698492 RepID=A0A0E9NID7_SAICN|nr:hypothetical protein G7K_3586-t1 [Saitoella complicata NRRL Y-17804]